MILPDTSVWIDYLGRKQRPQSEYLLGQLRRKANVCVCQPILQEVLQGARDEVSFGRIRNQMEALIWKAPSDGQHLSIQAARLYARLRWRGVTIRSPNDCLIACLAVEHGLTLLHDDTDFDKIASAEPRLKLA